MERAGAAKEDSLRRSWALLQAFRLEQSRPDVFYGALADDTVRMVRAHTRLEGARVVDVGAGPGQFAAAFLAAGASYVAVDCDREALDPLPNPNACAVLASGTALPIATASMDVAISSNVFEHVRNPVRLCDELARVVRPGGLVVISYTNWLSPWGGHETSPFHYLGGKRAIRLYTRRYGHPPKNQVGDNLFRVSVAQGLGWARSTPGIDLVEARPRYYPGWLAWLVRVPGLREVVTWNVWMVLRKR